jgi:hypothetical protein
MWDPTIEEIVEAFTHLHEKSKSVDDFRSEAFCLIRRPRPIAPRLVECSVCKRIGVMQDVRDAHPDKWYLPDTENSWSSKEFLRDYFTEEPEQSGGAQL